LATIAQVLEVNWTILYFVYGQVFFIMGLVTGLQLRRTSHLELARALPWLAAFGITHGFVEWGYIFVPAQALYLEDAGVRLLMLAHLAALGGSFFFLLQFGVELASPSLPHRRWPRLVPVALFLLWGSAVILRAQTSNNSLNLLLAIGDGWSRNLLCLPGSILAFLGLRRQARQVKDMGLPRIAAYLLGAAVAFLAYGVVAGLIVPTTPLFPANVINYALLDRIVGLPMPVFRSLCGLAMAIFVVRSLAVFRAETERRIAEMEEAHTLAQERERIGRELHDGIIQNIYAAGLQLERIPNLPVSEASRGDQVGSVLAILDQTIQDIRRYVFDLRAVQQPHALEIALANLVRDLRLDTMLEVDLNVTGEPCWQMGSVEVSHLTQIGREAFSNVVRHANAQKVTIELEYSLGQLRLSVADDGEGLADGPPTAAGHGRGLSNMRERCESLGGQLSLSRSPGGGLEVQVIVPCPPATAIGSAPDQERTEE
jgi:signal transduction histidine kinase